MCSNITKHQSFFQNYFPCTGALLCLTAQIQMFPPYEMQIICSPTIVISHIKVSK